LCDDNDGDDSGERNEILQERLKIDDVFTPAHAEWRAIALRSRVLEA